MSGRGRCSCQPPSGVEHGGPGVSPLDHDLPRATTGDRARERLASIIAADHDLQFGLTPEHEVAPLDQRPDRRARIGGSREARTEVGVDGPDPRAPFQERHRRGARPRAQHRGDPGHEERSGLLDRDVVEVARTQGARGGARPPVADTPDGVSEHQARRTPRIGPSPAEIDALAAEGVADPVARRVVAEPAHPCGAEPSARHRHARVALGSAVGGRERARRHQVAVVGDEREHRLPQGEQIEPLGHVARPAACTVASARARSASSSSSFAGGRLPVSDPPSPTAFAPAAR